MTLAPAHAPLRVAIDRARLQGRRHFLYRAIFIRLEVTLQRTIFVPNGMDIGFRAWRSPEGFGLKAPSSGLNERGQPGRKAQAQLPPKVLSTPHLNNRAPASGSLFAMRSDP
jgi:hypothetical protein